MSTAGPAFADTALTQEASVLVQGAGLVNVGAADRPVLFTDPQSLSFGYLDVNAGAASRAISVLVSDAGEGAGAWSVEVQPQVTSSGASVESGSVHARERWDGGRPGGRQRRRGGATGRQLRLRPPPTCGTWSGASRTRSRLPVRSSREARRPRSARVQTGDTRSGDDRARVYRWPTLPFGILSIFGVDPSVNDDGREKVYTLDIARQAVNAGVVDRPSAS